MQLVHPAHQREISGRGCPWQIINAAPADVEHLGLLGDRQIMRTVDHRFALGQTRLARPKNRSPASALRSWHAAPSGRPGTLAPRLRAEHPSRPVEKLRLPLGDLVGMNVELLC